jgi:hypothetical protein
MPGSPPLGGGVIGERERTRGGEPGIDSGGIGIGVCRTEGRRERAHEPWSPPSWYVYACGGQLAAGEIGDGYWREAASESVCSGGRIARGSGGGAWKSSGSSSRIEGSVCDDGPADMAGVAGCGGGVEDARVRRACFIRARLARSP